MDWSILYWIQENLRSGLMDHLMLFVTTIGGYGVVWILSGFILLFTKKYRFWGLVLLAALAAGVLIGNGFLKHFVARPRPCWLDPAVQLLISVPRDYSFPSGHTLASVIGATVLTAANGSWGRIAIPLAMLVSFSRLYLFVHFPTDILGAIVLGLLISFVTIRLCVTHREFTERTAERAYLKCAGILRLCKSNKKSEARD